MNDPRIRISEDCEPYALALQYAINFYLGYFCRWPDMCAVQETPQGRMMGYGTSRSPKPLPNPPSPRLVPHSLRYMYATVIGKAEGRGTELHGHVTALTVAPEYRRLGLSRKFMAWLEKVSDENYHGCFVDLYVRCVNFAAINMYEGFGYSVYRRVREYYSNLGLGFGVRDEEDGFGTFLSSVAECMDGIIEMGLWQTCGNRCPEILCDDLYERMGGISS